MQHNLLDFLKCLREARTAAEFCMICPMNGVVLDDKTVKSFMRPFIEDVVANKVTATTGDETDDEWHLTTFIAQKFCMFMRETDMLDAAATTDSVQDILDCFFEKYIVMQSHIATEQERAKERDCVLSLFFKSVDTRKPGLLASLKTADKRNLLRLIAEYTNISEYLHLMKQFVDVDLHTEKLNHYIDDKTSYDVLRMTFGHTIRSLVSCGVDPYEKAKDGKSFADLVLRQNYCALAKDNYDGYLETTEEDEDEEAEEQAV